MQVSKVGIVGAGAAGLIAAKVLVENGLEVSIFERLNHVGGVWKSFPGSVMYSSLRTNLPKQIMSFDVEDRFTESQGNRSFVTADDVERYLDTFTSCHSLHSLIMFESEVVSIEKALIFTGRLGNMRWTISYNCLRSGEICSSDFDAVIVCNGHFNIPLSPTLSIPGLAEHFRGRMVHSVEYDSLKSLISAGTRVLVVGTKSSGTDMARELSKEKKCIVYVSDRHLVPPAGAGIVQPGPENLFWLSALQHCDEDGSLHFANGERLLSSEDDIILWCTGYLYDFPFLRGTPVYDELFPSVPYDGALPSPMDDVRRFKRVDGLYQHLLPVSKQAQGLAFIGLPFSIVPFPFFYTQALLLAALWTQQLTLPPAEAQIQWLSSWKSNVQGREARLLEKELPSNSQGHWVEKTHYLGGDLQWEYLHGLCDLMDDLPEESKLLATVRAHRSFLRLCQEVYEDCTSHRPKYPGAADSYRDREYRIWQASSAAEGEGRGHDSPWFWDVSIPSDKSEA